MNTLITSRRPAVAYGALVLLAFGCGTCAADEHTRGQIAANLGVPVQAPAVNSADSRQCAGQQTLVAPDGHEFSLAYFPGYGCKYVVHGDSEIVAIGPNGYAFAWTHDSGWRLLKTVD